MFTKMILASVISVSLTACGGGGGGGSAPTSATPVVTPAPTPIPTVDYSCDPVTALAATTKTLQYSNTFEMGIVGIPIPKVEYESWQLSVDGEQNTLVVAIVRPPAGVTIKGINMTNHGQSDTQATAPANQMVQEYWMVQMATRGYISVAVARRGNFGSTGKMYYTATTTPAGYQLAYFKYQAASVIAAMDKMAADLAYKPYMSTILLDGTSAGSDTVMQVATDSATFRAATKKAIIRFDGGVGASVTNSTVIAALGEYGATIGKSGVPSLWIIGDQDQISLPGPVACQFKFFNQATVAAGYSNTLYTVPGMGHVGPVVLFTPALRQIFREYMSSRGFDGFN